MMSRFERDLQRMRARLKRQLRDTASLQAAFKAGCLGLRWPPRRPLKAKGRRCLPDAEKKSEIEEYFN